MLRFIIKSTTCCPDGSVVKVQFNTLEIEHTELEKILNTNNTYTERYLIGCEIIKKENK